MPDIDIQVLLDEIMLLHGVIAVELLNQFKEPFGASFRLEDEHHEASALARADVPAHYSPEYGDEEFESRAKELLKGIAPRIAEIMNKLGELGIKPRDINLIAERSVYRKKDKRLSSAIDLFGAISGGLGALHIKRNMLYVNHHAITKPTTVEITSIIEDEDNVALVKEAMNAGLVAALRCLNDNRLMLNQGIKDHDIDNQILIDWLANVQLSNSDGATQFDYKKPVLRLTTLVDKRDIVIYTSVGKFEVKGPFQIEFDPRNGFDFDRTGVELSF